jgi:ribosomal protein S18 acetylase RimI-like enzyme
VERCRPATDGDAARVVELARLLRAELGELRGGELWSARDAVGAPLDAAFAGWLADAATEVVVGTIDEVIVGYGVVEIETLRTGDRLGVILELFVESEGRSVGVGEAMVDALGARCAEAGCRGIDAGALPGHRAAKNFFETHGFTARAIVMHRDSGEA